jgi:hypothetical protein
MGKAKTWSSIEAEAASRAFLTATHDSVHGSGQKGEDFAKRVHEAFTKLAPPGVEGSGTYGERDPGAADCKVWHYVRDVILKDVQKFNGTVNIVMNMGLSRVSHQEKINIAVALFTKKMKKDDNPYDHKDFEATKWRLYRSWNVLKDSAKAAAPSASKRPSEEIESSEGEANEGFITDSSPSGPTSTSKQLHEMTKGNKRFKGRDAAKKAELKEEQNARRVAALDKIATTEKSKLKVISNLKLQVKAQNMIAMLNHPSVTSNPILSNQLYNKIMSLINSDNPPSMSQPPASGETGMTSSSRSEESAEEIQDDSESDNESNNTEEEDNNIVNSARHSTPV